jgi:hypothetical protein
MISVHPVRNVHPTLTRSGHPQAVRHRTNVTSTR